MSDTYKIYNQLFNDFKRSNFKNLYKTFKSITDINVLFIIILTYNILNNNALVPIINKEDVFETLANLYKINEVDLQKLLYNFEIPLRTLKGKELVNYLKLLENSQLLLKVISIINSEDYIDIIYDAYLRKDIDALSVYVKIVEPKVMSKSLYETSYKELKDYVEINGLIYNQQVKDMMLNVHNPYIFLTYLIETYPIFAENIKIIVYKNEEAMKMYTSYYTNAKGSIKKYLIDLFILYFSDYKVVNISSLLNTLKSNGIYDDVIYDISYKEKDNTDLLPFPGYYYDKDVKDVDDNIRKTLELFEDYEILINEMISKSDNYENAGYLINNITNIKKFFKYTSEMDYFWSYNDLNYEFIDSEKYADDYFTFVVENTKKTRKNMISGIISYITYYSYEKVNIEKLVYIKNKIEKNGLFNEIQDTVCDQLDFELFKAIERDDKEIINFINSIISVDCKKRLAKNRKISKIHNEISKKDNQEIMPILNPVFENIVFKFLESKKYIKETGMRIVTDKRIYIVDYDYYLRSVYYIIRNKFYAENIVEDLIFESGSNVECLSKDDFIYYLGENEYSYYDHKNTNMKIKIDYIGNTPSNVLDYIYYVIYQNLTKCKDGFKLYSIYKEGVSIGHRVIIYFENINDVITMYYYDPHGYENTTSQELEMYKFFEFITECLNYISMTHNYKYKFKFEQFFSGCPLGLQVFSSSFDIGMCQTFTLFWLYNIVQIKKFIRNIKYINDLPMSKIIPRIEEYYSTKLTDYELYNLLISFLSEFINEFLSKNEKINKVLSKRILDQLELEYINRSPDERQRIKIYNLKQKDVEVEQEKMKNYKQIIKEQDNKVKNRINFIVNKQVEEQMKIYQEEEKRIKNKPGKPLIEICDYDVDCASECCSYSKKHNEKVCSPQVFCKERHEKKGLSGLNK
jgi:hypothetical protein